MTDLPDFLLARFAEEQALAEAVGPNPTVRTSDPAVTRFLEVWHPDRVIDECEAKRRIVYELRTGEPGNQWANEAWRRAESDVLRLLALPYADHPDFREEWRP